MPKTFKNEENKRAATAGGEDHISALPDALLQHLLSFLPSCQAVGMCVLARRWRHQWKSVPAMRITDVDSFQNVQQLNRFVDHLLLLGGRTPIHECELDSYDSGDIAPWYQYAVSCQCRVLQVGASHASWYLRLPEVAIISQQLERLQLDGVQLEGCSLDFSSCLALEVLKMHKCIIRTGKILPQSFFKTSEHNSMQFWFKCPYSYFCTKSHFLGAR
ncbi:F-box/FBD/LRR-repeat protein At5g22660-like [Phragmites australis]|uniref:F-box/FBD/LRR-repeat protein At5g22660-like n=1 Tax=Phragmites australis TaxID=29695 RepID=UPI002D790EF3|nr:F-box/FBD/LRR-repeat protein At5g22660-like [Phragmites australis]